MRKRPVSKGTLATKKAKPFRDSSFSQKNNQILLNMSSSLAPQRTTEDECEESKLPYPK